MATADTAAGAAQPARHVLAVYAHPWAHSFTGFILHSAVRGARAAGHSVEIADLYAEGFDPVLRHADYAQFDHKPMPEDVRREQARVERSDALMFAFPVWWWSFPAMRTQIDIGVMSYAGLTDVRSQFFYEIDDDPESHEEHLRLAYELGRTFLAPEPA
jgi:putative NADPH-quinone reductase